MLANLDPQRKSAELKVRELQLGGAVQAVPGSLGALDQEKGEGQPPVLQRDCGVQSYGLILGGAQPMIFEHIY